MSCSSSKSEGEQGNPRSLLAWLPAFRLERCGWNAHERVALVAPVRGALRVLSTTPVAARLGIHAGMSAAEARALLPELHLEHGDSLHEESQDLEALAGMLHPISPHSLAHPPDAILAEIGTTAGLLGGETACLEQATRILSPLGHFSRVVIVEGHGETSARAARALARWKDRHLIVPTGQLSSALEDLPLPLLEPSPSLLELLRSLGITRAGELARLPAAAVANRMGSEGLALLALARGETAPSPGRPAPRESPLPLLHKRLPAPLSSWMGLGPLLLDLSRQLCRLLHRCDRAVVRLQLRLLLEEAPSHLLPVRLGRPQRNPHILSVLLRRRLEDLQLPAPLLAIEMEVLESCPFVGHQPSFLDREAHEPLLEILARLGDGLGEVSLFRATLRDSHRPEEAWSRVPFLQGEPEGSPNSLPRPALVLPEPRPLQLRFDGALPWAVEIEGHWCRIQEHEGPERLAGAWWEAGPLDRDYHQLRLEDGRRPWIFENRQEGSWWLHGWFA